MHAAEAELERQGWRKATLNERVAAWQGVVEEVEQGYATTIDDYTNDFAVRVVGTCLAVPNDPSAGQPRCTLASLDERFRVATVAAATRMPGAGDGWYCRLPRVLVGELADDATRMNLVPLDRA